MNLDVAIRGGTVVDGTGAPPRAADVGIADGRIVEIGPELHATRELDASGLLVLPGFLDLHTHYDPQVLWDPELTPSSYQGVTSVVAGNCGFSLAPCPAEMRASMLRTLDGVEDMRVDTLRAGIEWTFETHPEYLAHVAAQGTAVNFGGYVGHTAVRLAVMGQAGYERDADADELAAMHTVVVDALARRRARLLERPLRLPPRRRRIPGAVGGRHAGRARDAHGRDPRRRARHRALRAR